MSTEEEVERKKSNQNERTILDILTRTLSKDSPTRYLSPDASAAALEIPPLEVLGEGASVLAFSSGAAFLRRILLVSFFFLFHLSRNENEESKLTTSPSAFRFFLHPPPLRSFAQHGRRKSSHIIRFLSLCRPLREAHKPSRARRLLKSGRRSTPRAAMARLLPPPPRFRSLSRSAAAVNRIIFPLLVVPFSPLCRSLSSLLSRRSNPQNQSTERPDLREEEDRRRGRPRQARQGPAQAQR